MESVKRKRNREGTFPGLERAVTLWISSKNVKGSLPSADMILTKAKMLATQMGLDFEPSESWVRRMKKRNNISYKKAHGEKLSADAPAAKQFVDDELPKLLEKYHPDDIFNCDETGLYWRGISDRGYHVKNNNEKHPSGGKVPKERLTIMPTANMSGTEKLPLLAIGKFNKPRCFPKDQNKLPLVYTFSKNAWMTGRIFGEYLLKWNNNLKAVDRKILLLVDNHPGHPKGLELSNIEVVFLPENTTSLIQPMDQGIIRNFKGHYRSKLHQRIINSMDLNPDLTLMEGQKSVSLLDAIHLAAESWDQVTETTIKNCFKHGGFSPKNDEQLNPLHDVDIPVDMAPDDFERIVDQDVDAPVVGELTDQELIQASLPSNDNDDDESDEEDVEPPLREILESLTEVRTFSQKNGLSTHILSSLKTIENMVTQEKSVGGLKPT